MNPPVPWLDAIRPVDPRKRTAVLIAAGYDAVVGPSTRMMSRMFANTFDQWVLLCVGPLAPGEAAAGGRGEGPPDDDRTPPVLLVYVAAGADPVGEAEVICLQIAGNFAQAVFFVGKLVFQPSRWYHPLLHGNGAERIRRRLEQQGIPHVVLPVVAKL